MRSGRGRWVATGQRSREAGRSWTGGGLLVIVLGVSANLLLTFAPDVVPTWVASAVVVCTSATLVVVAATFLVQRLRQTSDAEAAAARAVQEADDKRRELRGVVAAGKERVRGAEFSEILLGARERLIIHGVGMSVVSREVDLIRTAALGGLEIHIVMVDPRWLRKTWGMAGALARFYDNPQILRQVEKSYRDIATMAREVNAECAEERVRVHTYRAISPFGATIAEPGTPEVKAVIEFHITGRLPRRIRFVVEYYQDDARDRSLVSQIIDAISDLSGYNFSAATPDRSRGAEQTP